MRRRPLIFAATIALSIGGISGCATYSERTDLVRRAVDRGAPSDGIAELNKILKVRKPDGLPKKWKKNFALVVLERATLHQGNGDYEMSASDFQVADKQLELLDIARDTAGKIGKYIYSDSSAKYKTSPTEKLALNAMNMCNYLARGDLKGARIEAKRFTVMRNYLRDYDPEHEHGAFGSYLAGYVNERLGNRDEALRYYDEALQEREFASLREPIVELARRSSYRGERIEDYLPQSLRGGFRPLPDKAPPPSAKSKAGPAASGAPPAEPPPAHAPKSATLNALGPSSVSNSLVAPPPTGAEILMVAKVGRVPLKIPKRIPIGAAIGLAGAFVTGNTALLEYGAFKFVTYPELAPSGSVFDKVSMSVDGHQVGVDLATDLGAEIQAEYEELRPKIIGAAITRMITRAVAAEAARAAGSQADGAGGLVGFLAAAAVEGTLVALDKPDTRSWTTLAARVYVARARVPAGNHRVVVTAFGPGGKERRTFNDVSVAEGGFVVLDVTTLR